MTTTTLDLTGLKCPLPALMTRKALKGLPPQMVCLPWIAPPFVFVVPSRAARFASQTVGHAAEDDTKRS